MRGSAEFVLAVTASGYGKRVPVRKLPRTNRGTQGVRLSTPPLAGATVVGLGDTVVIATRRGKVEAIAVADVPQKGRRARGVRLVALDRGDQVSTVALVPRGAAGGVSVQPRGSIA